MSNNNASLRNTAREALKEIIESQRDLENFHTVTMARVFGMLSNAELFNLHPLVKKHLEAIQKLGAVNEITKED